MTTYEIRQTNYRDADQRWGITVREGTFTYEDAGQFLPVLHATEAAARAAVEASKARGDFGAYTLTACGKKHVFPTLRQAYNAYDEAGRWARGFRWLENATTGEVLATDHQGSRIAARFRAEVAR